MTVVQVIEGRNNWIPEFRLEDLPDSLPEGIRPVVQAGRIGLNIQGVVGTLPLASGNTLQILPKVGQANFLYMLFRSMGDKETFQKQFEELASYGHDEQANVSLMAARSLLDAAIEVLARGPLSRRERQIATSTFSSGRLLPGPTALRIRRRASKPVVSAARVRSHSNAENRVIAGALRVAASLLADHERVRAIHTAHRWEKRVCSQEMRPQDVQEIQERVTSGWYGGPRDYYAAVMALSLVLIGARGLVTSEKANLQGEAFLMNSADVFENYVRRVISDAYSPAGYLVTKGGIARQTLYQDGAVELKPDVVVENTTGIKFIADAKYKKPDAGDHYQLLSYLMTTEVGVGALITPEGRDSTVNTKVHHTAWGATTIVADLPMSKPDVAEEYLAGILSSSN